MRVLCVEDDALVGDIIGDLLNELGHEVTCCAGGLEALDQLSRVGPFGLLITDIRLGRGGDGRALVKLAREAYPALPVIYITGDTYVRSIGSDDQLLRKPCTLGMLEKAIAHACSAGPRPVGERMDSR